MRCVVRHEEQASEQEKTTGTRACAARASSFARDGTWEGEAKGRIVCGRRGTRRRVRRFCGFGGCRSVESRIGVFFCAFLDSTGPSP